MYLQFVIACFIATFFSIHGGPVDYSVYEMIKRSAGDVNLKCPYVRTTKLFEPQPAFFSKCVSYIKAQSLTVVDQTNVEDGLCLLYYDNFEHLCYVSNNYTEVSKEFLSNAQIDQISKAYQNNVSQVCAVLKNTHNFVEDLKSGIEAVRKHLEDSRKCERICTDLDLNVKPMCALSAFMLNATKNIYKEIQSLVSPDARNDKIRSKPSLTDHNADIKGDSKNKIEIINKQPNVPGVSQSALFVEHNPDTAVEGQSPNIQKLPAQNPISPNTSVGVQEDTAHEHRWEKFLSGPKIEEKPTGGKPADEHDQQSATTKSKSSLGDASIKQQGKKPEEQSKAEQGVVQTPPSVVTPTNIHPSKVEIPVVAPTIPGPKPGPPISNNPLTGIKTNINDAQKPGASNVLPSEETIGSKIGPKEEEVADVNNNQVGADETPLGGGNLNFPINDEFPNEDDTNKDQKNGIATKEDGGIEAAGESPQEAKDQFEDSDIEGLGNDQDDYSNMNDDLPPKSSEVKTKPQEISKPLETNEDGPSFAANYQNQSIDDSDSYFFSYFMMVCIMFICGYVAYHNKQKILALVVEGRKGRRPSRTRRPNSANYRKLDSNLEEAVTSSCNKNATQVIY